MAYTYDYPRPAVTVDCLLFSQPGASPDILLVQRDKPPYESQWALPGGFVEMDENLEEAVYRELQEETNLSEIALDQFRAFGEPGRDPRGRTISIVYFGFVDQDQHQPRAGSDARSVRWFNLDSLPPLAFDHGKIIALARQDLGL